MTQIKLKTKQIKTEYDKRFTSDAEMGAKAFVSYVDGRDTAVIGQIIGTASTDGDTLGKLNDKIAGIQSFFNGDDASLDTLRELSDGIKARVKLSDRNVANGFAGLNATGQIPLSLFPDIMLGNVRFMGTYDGITDTISSPDATLNGQPLPVSTSVFSGQYFICQTAFVFGGKDYSVGDWIISNGSAGWDKVDNSDAVTTVFGRNGNIVANAGDYTTAQVTEVPGYLYYTDDRVGAYGDNRYVKYANAIMDMDIGGYALSAGSATINGDATINGSANFNGDINLNGFTYLGGSVSVFYMQNTGQQRRIITVNQAGAPGDIGDLQGWFINGNQVANIDRFGRINSAMDRPDAIQLYGIGNQGITWWYGNSYSSVLKAPVLTGNYTWTLPNATGTLALESNIPSLAGYARLADQSTFTSNFSVGASAPTTRFSVSQNDSAVLPSVSAYAGMVAHFAGADGQNSRVMIDAWGTGKYPLLTFRHARGTAAAPTATQSGDVIANITAQGYGATAYQTPSTKQFLSVQAAENWTDAAQGTATSLWSVAIGANTSTERVRVYPSGNVAIQNGGVFTDDGVNALQVNGGILSTKISVGGINAGPQLFYMSGSLAASGLTKYRNLSNVGYSSNDFCDDLDVMQMAFGYGNTGVTGALAGMNYFYLPNKPLGFFGTSSAEIMRMSTTAISMSVSTAITKSGVGTSITTDGLSVGSTASTAASTQNHSPLFRISANVWNTTTVVNDRSDFVMQNRGTSGATTSGTLFWAYQNAAGGYTDLMSLLSNGTLRLANVANIITANNSNLGLGLNGASITRNIADANTAFTVNQVNAASTGYILQLLFAGTAKTNIDLNGNIQTGGSLTLGTPSAANSILRLGAPTFSTSTAYNVVGFGIRQDAITYTSTAGSGTQATTYVNSYAAATLAAANATTLTKVYGNFFYQPIASTNVAFGQVLALGTTGDAEINGTLYVTNRVSVGKITVPGAALDIDPTYSTSNVFNTLGFGLRINSSNNTYTSTAAAGTQASGTMASFGVSTFAATNATTVTNASTLYIAGPPIAGANMTLTNAWSFYMATGSAFFGGGVYGSSFNNSSGSVNASVVTSVNGTSITRNIADANTALIIDQVNASSTGPVQAWRFASSNVALMSSNGFLYGPGMNNLATSANASITTTNNGTNISRNIADTNPALVVNLQNATSTGSIQVWQFATSTVAHISQSGVYYGGGLNNFASSSNSAVSVLASGVVASRNIADGNTAFTVNQVNATSTGAVQVWQFASANVGIMNTLGELYINKVNNLTTSSNAQVAMNANGVNISRNVADGNSALVVNLQHASSTGLIQQWAFNGTQVAFVTQPGVFFGTGIANMTDGNNSRVQTLTTGTIISRNIADAGNTLLVNNINATSTGHIQVWQFQNADVARLQTNGYLYGKGVIDLGGSQNGFIGVGNATTSNSITRNVADGATTLNVANSHASSTGSIQSWSFNGSIVAHVPASGTFFGAGLANLADPLNSRIQSTATGANITRDKADANAALTVNQINASSTGNILNLQFGGANRFTLDTFGNSFYTGRVSIGANTNGAVLGLYNGLTTSASYSTSGFGIRQDAVTFTSTAVGATIAATYVNSFATATLAASNATTLTKAYGNWFSAPATGANVTIGASFSAGFNGSIEVGNEIYTGGRIAVGFTTVGGLGAMVHINPTNGFITSGGPSNSGFAISQQSINYTSNAVAGTPTFGVVNSFAGGVFNAANTQTITNAINVYIPGPPTAGTNTTIANAYSLYVASGSTYIGSNLIAAGAIYQTNGGQAYTTGGFSSLVRNTTTGRFETIAITGTGNNVFSDSPTLTGTIIAASASMTGSLTMTSTSTGFTHHLQTDQTTNYEVVTGRWVSGTYTISTDAAGTGSIRNIQIGTRDRKYVITQSGNLLGFFQYTGDTSAPDASNVGIGGSIWRAASGMQNMLAIVPGFTQTGTAGYRAIWVSPYEQTLGTGVKYLIDLGTNTVAHGAGTHTSKFTVDNGGGIFSSYFSSTASMFNYTQPNAGIGTVSVTAASPTVTGVGTQFTTSFKVGQAITISGETHLVTSITSNTVMATAAWTGTFANATYTVAGGIRFEVNGSGDATLAGNLALGASSTFVPLARLHIVQALNTSADGIRVDNVAGNAAIRLWTDTAGNSRVSANNTENNNIVLNGGGTGTGKVLISTLTSFNSDKLQVLMDATQNGSGISVRAVNTGGPGSQPGFTFQNPSGSLRMYSYLDVSSDTYNIGNAAGAALMTINQAGSVGIGYLTDQGAKLAVKGNAIISPADDASSTAAYNYSSLIIPDPTSLNNTGGFTFKFENPAGSASTGKAIMDVSSSNVHIYNSAWFRINNTDILNLNGGGINVIIGDVEVATTGNGFTAKSPNGTKWRLTPSDAGASVWTLA